MKVGLWRTQTAGGQSGPSGLCGVSPRPPLGWKESQSYRGPFPLGGHGSLARMGALPWLGNEGSTLGAGDVCGVPRLTACFLQKYFSSRHLEFGSVY